MVSLSAVEAVDPTRADEIIRKAGLGFRMRARDSG